MAPSRLPENGFDPRFMRLHENYPSNDPSWGIDARTLPVHAHHVDDKYASKSTIEGAGAVFARLRAAISQFWPTSRGRSSWPHSAPSKPLTLAAPSSSNLVFVLLCALWYTSSALSSNTGKAILMQFRYPVTLTFVQFGFVALYCLLFMSPAIRFTKLRKPTWAILQNTLPMGMFQVGGHMFSSIAIARIPVSTVHTIKALSPLFTVAAYALLFGVSYSTKTYVSLLPLTIGVMLACSFDMSASNAIGLLSSFGSALVFVSSNIFFKKIMPTNAGNSPHTSHKLDKLNLLLYSSGVAFLLMFPLWIYHDLPILFSSSTHIAHPKVGHETPHSVVYYFFMNGTVHFAQNIIAFVILSMTSPVTYSIASLIKRVAVICIAIIWFKQNIHPVQGCGILLTFIGLYLYNNAKSDVEKGEKKMRRVEAARDLMLPMTKDESQMMNASDSATEVVVAETTSIGHGFVYGRPRSATTTSPLHAYPHTIHHHQRPNAMTSHNLTIKVTSPGSKTRTVHLDTKATSPVDSYPSPPPSLDSPPSDTVPLGQAYNSIDSIRDQQVYPKTVTVS